ncbi:MAG: alanine dehydrogenase, partial [Candidatus Marinimicrobia bacterium]|nr:alanine dehydrogenase [Candidatus Neomarinimicrobiota bacterium]
MNVGIVHETRNQEHRVALNPAGVLHLTNQNVIVYVQTNAGLDSGWTDEQYIQAGAHIVFSTEEVYGRSDVLMKISPLERDEIDLIREEQTIFSWQHLVVRHQDIIDALIEKNATVIGYEL